jgi:hypothetical protein
MTQAFNLSQFANKVNTSGQADLTTAVTGTLPVANLPTVTTAKGGLGITTTPANGQIPIGNGTNYVAANITAGTNITITNSAGGISIAASGGAPTTAQVLSATAGASAGDVGSYAFLGSTAGILGYTQGSNYAGSSLYWSGMAASTNGPFPDAASAFADGVYTSLSGTWKCMGANGNYAGANRSRANLFLRVA